MRCVFQYLSANCFASFCSFWKAISAPCLAHVLATIVHLLLLHCALNLAAQCIVIGPVCVFACLQRAGGRAGGRAVSEPYYSQRTRCLRLSERFFHRAMFYERIN